MLMFNFTQTAQVRHNISCMHLPVILSVTTYLLHRYHQSIIPKMSMSQVSMSSFKMPGIEAVLGDEAPLLLGFWGGKLKDSRVTA